MFVFLVVVCEFFCGPWTHVADRENAILSTEFFRLWLPQQHLATILYERAQPILLFSLCRLFLRVVFFFFFFLWGR